MRWFLGDPVDDVLPLFLPSFPSLQKFMMSAAGHSLPQSVARSANQSASGVCLVAKNSSQSMSVEDTNLAHRSVYYRTGLFSVLCKSLFPSVREKADDPISAVLLPASSFGRSTCTASDRRPVYPFRLSRIDIQWPLARPFSSRE